MKNAKKIHLKITTVTFALLLATVISCERNLSEDAVFAELGSTAEIYTDAPVGLTDEFFTSFDPAEGANVEGFGTDDTVAYAGTSSIRIDVPAANDPNGGFIGGIFKDRGEGRNLTRYDALTFWAKGSTTATIGLIGFGTDFIEDKYAVGLENVQLSTDWKKYIIPIPDASKLIQVKGMFTFSAGSNSTGGNGYTFWIDELKFEDLGTIAQPRPAILNGVDEEQIAFLDNNLPINGLTQTFNIGSGENITVNAAPSYFDFESSDIEVARVSELGVVSIVDRGVATITASLAGVQAEGSLTINSNDDFDFAPTPTRSPDDVISIFSDAYTNVPVDYYNGFWQGSSTLSADFEVDGDNILSYTNLNYVGTLMSNPTVDATDMTHVHFNMYIPDEVPSNFDFLISIEDFGADQVDGGPDDVRQQIFVSASQVSANTWITIDVPLTIANQNNIGLIIYENINGSSLSNFYIDNVYFYRE